MNILILIAFLLLSYLLGSIPFGLVYSLARGVDIRKVGSKNIGATNVSREFGFISGFLPVFILDLLKGAVPVYLAGILFNNYPVGRDAAMVLAGAMTIIGHIFPVYLGFRGGKGVATALGVFLPIVPVEAMICLGVFMVTLTTFRIVTIAGMPESLKKNINTIKLIFMDLRKGVGLSSSAAAFFFPISVALVDFNRTLIFVISIAVAVLVIFQHRSNLAGYLKGGRQ